MAKKKKPAPKRPAKKATKKKPEKRPALTSTAQLVADMANPRKIDDKAAAGLSRSIEEFGDLSGIVFNQRTGELVSGHQRMTQIREKHGDREIRVVDAKAGLGVIEIGEGQAFGVRIVDWPKAKQRAANVAANNQKIAGEFTEDLSAYLMEFKGDVAPDLYDDLLMADLVDDSLDRVDAMELGEHEFKQAEITTIKFAFSSESHRDSVMHAVEKMKSSGEFAGMSVDGQAIAAICREYLKP